MGKAGMAIHSDASFNEAKEIRLLSDFLESHKTVKTFFSENDKTPNHDGFFELVSKEGMPKKQFIVQIKKIENIEKCTTGINKDKYVYSLSTNFLYYVKAKVTENPAIFFVVDIAKEKIFYRYLSDEALISLNFEGKEHVSCKFSEQDVLTDIDSFTKLLNDISIKRNKKFIGKSKEEIAEIQDAVEYINDLFNNDLKFIKNEMFPNLWRFGIASSSISDFSISYSSRQNVQPYTITSPNTSAFAIYPQIKGELDYGFQEYSQNTSKIYKSFDLTGNTTPKDYVNDVISEILDSYFNNMYSDIYPTEIYEEIIYEFIDMYDNIIFGKSNKCSCIQKLDDINEKFSITMYYLDHIIQGKNLTSTEYLVRKRFFIPIGNKIIMNNNIDILQSVNFHLRNEFKEFCNLNRCKKINFPPQIFKFTDKIYNMYFLSIKELQKRKVENIHNCWTYNQFEFSKTTSEKIKLQVNSICKIWFQKLQEIYLHTYKKCFNNPKYFNRGEFKYLINIPDSNLYNSTWCVKKYDSTDFKIMQGEEPYSVFSDFGNKDDNYLTATEGGLFEWLSDKKLCYDGLRCLLYQGICETLNIKCNGIKSKCGISKYIFD